MSWPFILSRKLAILLHLIGHEKDVIIFIYSSKTNYLLRRNGINQVSVPFSPSILDARLIYPMHVRLSVLSFSPLSLSHSLSHPLPLTSFLSRSETTFSSPQKQVSLKNKPCGDANLYLSSLSLPLTFFLSLEGFENQNRRICTLLLTTSAAKPAGDQELIDGQEN